MLAPLHTPSSWSVVISIRPIFRDSFSPWFVFLVIPGKRLMCFPCRQQLKLFHFLKGGCATTGTGIAYLSRTDQKQKSGSEIHLQIYLGPQNISLVFHCFVGYWVQKRAFVPEMGPLVPAPLTMGTRLEKPPSKVFYFEHRLQGS
jgi:hypothetical protein